MIEVEAVIDVAIGHTSVGGNNCPEMHALRHVTHITTRAAVFMARSVEAGCDGQPPNWRSWICV
jgi:hypothetical protein